MRPSVLALALAIAVALPAAAQQPDVAKSDSAAAQPGALPGMDKLMEYVGTQEYFKGISTVALGGEHDITPECKDAKVLGRAGFTVLTLPVWQEGVAAPVSGQWKDQIAVDRCGPKVVHNVLVSVEKDGPHVGLMLPGETTLPIVLQMKALQPAAATAMSAAKCTDANKVVVSDTRHAKLISEMKADATGRLTGGKWQETWTFRACGKTQPVAMTFTADGQGSATFEAKPAKAGGKK
jgi:hypothetical protein